MENHELGTHNDKMCAAILTGNSQNTPQLIRPIRQNRPIIWDFLEKSPHHMSTLTKPFILFKIIFFVFCTFCKNRWLDLFQLIFTTGTARPEAIF